MVKVAPQWLEGYIPYDDALALQEQHVIDLREGRKDETLYLLEHSPVYTIGRTRDQSSLREASLLPHPLVTISRGGQATYHGPGQLVGYPIIDLNIWGRDLHAYMRALEEAIIRTCSDFSVKAGRLDGMTGVWVENRKLASIGVGVRRWIALHGFAMNVTAESLPPFLAITPCGLDGVSMTSLSAEAGQKISVKEAGNSFASHFVSALLSTMPRVQD